MGCIIVLTIEAQTPGLGPKPDRFAFRPQGRPSRDQNSGSEVGAGRACARAVQSPGSARPAHRGPGSPASVGGDRAGRRNPKPPRGRIRGLGRRKRKCVTGAGGGGSGSRRGRLRRTGKAPRGEAVPAGVLGDPRRAGARAAAAWDAGGAPRR